MARSKKPPKGFTITPGKTSSSDAERMIRERLEGAAKAIPDSRALVHRYKNGAVDGEIAIPIKRGIKAEEMAFEIEEALGRKGFAPDIWFAAGARYAIKGDEEIYRKFSGMNEVGVHSQRANRSNVAEVLLILRTKVLKGLKKKFRRKAEVVYVRVSWSPDGKRPDIPLASPTVRRKRKRRRR